MASPVEDFVLICICAIAIACVFVVFLVRSVDANPEVSCPSCRKTVSQLELDENRGVCGLCFESLSSQRLTR